MSSQNPIQLPQHASTEPTSAVAVAPTRYLPTLPWHTMEVQDAMDLVMLDQTDTGITAASAPQRAKDLGDNLIPVAPGRSILLMFLGHFFNSISLILGIVVFVSAWFKDWAEFGVVLAVIILNGAVGFIQEYGAEKSVEELKDMTKGYAKVVRDGRVDTILVDDVVIGDVIILEQGSQVPCDVRLFETNNLEIDESLLTGESLAVAKHINAIPDPHGNCALGDRKNLAFRQTTVMIGNGKGITVCGGLHTEMGKISKKLSAETDNQTELQKKMIKLMYALFGVCLILAVVVFAANKWNFEETVIIYACAVAIAILPEALIAVITVAMTLSVHKMAEESKCIVRKLGALEVLGNVTDICSDKTGTLTQNKMVVAEVVIGTDLQLQVSGLPLSVFATFHNGDQQFGIAEKLEVPAIRDFLRAAALCSTTELNREGEVFAEPKGNPTEIAIQAMCWKSGANPDYWNEKYEVEEKGEYPFDSSIKRMTVGLLMDGEPFAAVKGAPERIMNLCKWYVGPSGNLVELTQANRDDINVKLEGLAAKGLRTICLSMRNFADGTIDLKNKKLADYERADVEKDLIYLGITGIFDPPRVDSRSSVLSCQQAGIKVRMLTGDHVQTATSIAKSLNIIEEGQVVDDTVVMAGPAFDRLTAQNLAAMPDFPRVIGRCSPETKVNMIEALHNRGAVVAMTGDGFNDSPSIKIADVGCAMGSGTDVTKGVADIIITKDDFASIVKAITEGRRIASSITKFVIHLLSGNTAEVIVLVIGLPIQHQARSVFVLSPIEILWLNMFTGSPLAIGLSKDDADPDMMRVPPNTAGFFTKEMVADCLCYGLFLGTCTLMSFVFVVYGANDGLEGNKCNKPDGDNCNTIYTARSTAFVILYLGLCIHAYNVRVPRRSVFSIKWFDNNWLWGSVVFNVLALIPILYVPAIANYVFVHELLSWEWAVVVVALAIFLALSELYKLVKNRVDPVHRIAPKVAEPSSEDTSREMRTIHQTGSTTEIAHRLLNASLTATTLKSKSATSHRGMASASFTSASFRNRSMGSDPRSQYAPAPAPLE